MEEKTKKITKKENYENLKEIVTQANVDNSEDLIAFIDKQIEILDKRAEAAKERADAKKAEGDELRAVVKSVLTNEFQTAEEITEQIEGEDISKAKVVARLTQLVNNGEAVKEDKVEDKKKRKVYKLATVRED